MSQSDLEKVLATSTKTKVAASEYTGLSSNSSGWGEGHREAGEYKDQSAISELSKLVVSRILNIQSDTRDS